MRYAAHRPQCRAVVGTAHGGRLEMHRGPLGEMPVVFLAGEPEQIGRQYGALLGDRIAENLCAGFALFASLGLPEAFIPTLFARAWERMAPFVPDAYRAEMGAIVEGARAAGHGLDAQAIEHLLTMTNLDLYRREERLAELLTPTEQAALAAHLVPGPPAKSCTTFAVWGSRTEDGKLYAARNLDWISQTGMHRFKLLSVYEPEEGAPFVTAGYAGAVGALAGMNTHGIALGQVGAFSTVEELDGAPWVLLARRVLQETDSAATAAAVLRDGAHTFGINYLVADGDPDRFGASDFHPDAAIIETHHRAAQVFWADDPKEHAAAWNAPDGTDVPFGLPLPEAVMRADTAFSPEVRGVQVADNGPANPEGDGNPLKGGTYCECHRPMYDMIRAYDTGSAYTFPVRNTAVIEEAAPRAIGLDEAVTIAGTVAHNTEKLADSDWNVMSVVYGATDRVLLVAYEHEHADGHWTNAPDTGYWRYGLDELLR